MLCKSVRCSVILQKFLKMYAIFCVFVISYLRFIAAADGKLWGVAYSPWRSNTGCNIGEDEINDDLTKIASIANAVRTYGMDCDFAPKVVQGTKERNLKLVLGVWVEGKEQTYRQQKSKLEYLLKSRPNLDHVVAVSVGNEALFRNEQSEDALISKIGEIRRLMRSYGYSTPVTTADVFDKYTDKIASSVDILLPNLHAFYANLPVDQSKDITFDLANRVKSLRGAKNKKFIVGETGWPTGGSDPRATLEASMEYLNDFHCRANDEELAYFYFEAFDGVWKNAGDSNTESHWGLGDSERNFKDGLNEALQC